MSKLVCAHADTCLPDYWGGHHLPHVSVPVYKGMMPADLLRALHSEVREDAIAGGITDTGEWHEAAHASIDAVEFVKGTDAPLFLDLDGEGVDCCESVYAYFVFQPCED